MKIIDTSKIVTPLDMHALSNNEREWMYNGLDCCVTLEIFYALEKELDSTTRVIYDRSLSLRAPILDMQMRGIRVDLNKRDKVIVDIVREMEALEERYRRILTDGIGCQYLAWGSDTQVRSLMYGVLQLRPIRKRNDRGGFSPTVNADALERLSINFYAAPLCAYILKLRELRKKLSFLRTGIDPDGRMRSTFNIAGTNTGRLASSESDFLTGTNLQNVDRALRSIFIPDPGKKFINVDLEQGDSRNLAAFCWEVFYEQEGASFAGSYLDACESADLHTTVCRMAWSDLDWPEDVGDVKASRKVAEQLFYRQDSYRQMAKKLGHGTNYLGTPHTMAMHTKMPVAIIEDFQKRYFGAFECIPAFHDWTQTQLEEYSQITTLHGRRRFFFGRTHDPKNNREAMETLRFAVAFAGQSMTADAVNKAMIQIWKDGSDDIELLNQVHDSLLFQVPEEACVERVGEILELGKAPLVLTGGRDFVVPNEAKIGFNWGDEDEKDNPLGLMKFNPSTPDLRKNEYRPRSVHDM